MNTQEAKIVGCRKAWIAFVAAISCLLIYILACVLSPPAWSPDSSKVAVLVTPPGEHPDKFAIFTYDIASGQRVLLDEVAADGVLSAPAWSPDGKWIAYYKVEPTPPSQAESSSEIDTNAYIRPKDEAEIKPDLKLPIAEELFSEENKMLPSLVLELAEELIDGQEDIETFDVKLIIVSPDAKERKILQEMKWVSDGDKDERETMVCVRPAWSPDSKRLFYVRGIKDIFYTGSMDMATGKTDAHILGSTGTPVVSPDGKWVASYLDDDDTLIAASVDGTMCKYVKLDLEFESETLLMLDVMFWSPDPKKLFVVDDESVLHAVDIADGKVEQYTDPDANEIAYFTLSSDGKKMYYIAGLDEDEDVDFEDQKFSLRYMNLQNKSTGVVFSFSGLPKIGEGGGRFSIAPNGKVVLLRGVIEDEQGEDKSALLFFDGKTQKIVKTDRWLLKPLYSDNDLIFEAKLLGKWRDEDVRISITKGQQEKTYKLKWVEEDDEEHLAAANLVRVKGMTFLGVFFDESILDKKDSSGSHLLPDFFMRIVQLEPKVLMLPLKYDDFAEMLEKDAESLEAGDTEDEDIIELERDDSS